MIHIFIITKVIIVCECIIKIIKFGLITNHIYFCFLTHNTPSMSKIKFLLFNVLLFSGLSFTAQAQDYNYKFRLLLKDKGTTQYSIGNPQEFLSQRAIDRRERQGIAITESDFPISEQYISDIESLGHIIVAKSKWLKSISVHCADSIDVEQLKLLPFVDDAVFVWKGLATTRSAKNIRKKDVEAEEGDDPVAFYGSAYSQIAVNKGYILHDSGFRGTGMQIAIIDAGFENLNSMPNLNANVIGVKDFVDQGTDMYNTVNDNHGLRVLSCITGNDPNNFVGTAPDAKIWILRSEDATSEFPIEEDYWVSAAEYADSIGVDLINSSLGYSTFDAPAKSYVYADMDGKTAFISKGAEAAFEKGIFVVVSAGNEGSKVWKKITAPGDAESVLTVGATNNNSILASFSSRGPSSDGRVKPDVMAMGQNCNVIYPDGIIRAGSGTSFSSPIMCGLIACLWQANPDMTNVQLLDIVRRSGNKFSTPNDDYGYGVVDMQLALDAVRNASSINEDFINKSSSFVLTSDNAGCLNVEDINDVKGEYRITIYSIVGEKVFSDNFSDKKTFDLNKSQKGLYIVLIVGQDQKESFKVFF